MLGACLLLGCSISSFAYRRHEQDEYQTHIFVLAIAASTAFGYILGINANIVMLGLIPWALCTAIIFSIAVHWIVRRCSRSRNTYTEIPCCEQGEKEVLPDHWGCGYRGRYVLWKQALQIDFHWYKHEIWLQSRQILTVNQVRTKKGAQALFIPPPLSCAGRQPHTLLRQK
jgi:hypothetical protein